MRGYLALSYYSVILRRALSFCALVAGYITTKKILILKNRKANEFSQTNIHKSSDAVEFN